MRLTLVLILLLSSTSILGCTCRYFRDRSAEDLLFKDVIFKGKILSMKQVAGEDGWPTWIKATFQMTTAIKAATSSDTISIYTDDESGSCGLDFQIGDTWLIFASMEEGRFETYECDASIRQGDEDDEKRINEILQKYLALKKGTRLVRDNSSSIEGEYDIFGQMKNGEPEGRWLRIRGNDTIAVFNYRNGERFGMQMEIDEDRYPVEKGYFEFPTGERNGIHRFFDADKKLQAINECKNGMPDGRHEAYDENGNVTQSGQYVKGRMEGVWITFWGKKKEVEKWVRGRLKERTTYDENGNVIKE